MGYYYKSSPKPRTVRYFHTLCTDMTYVVTSECYDCKSASLTSFYMFIWRMGSNNLYILRKFDLTINLTKNQGKLDIFSGNELTRHM